MLFRPLDSRCSAAVHRLLHFLLRVPVCMCVCVPPWPCVPPWVQKASATEAVAPRARVVRKFTKRSYTQGPFGTGHVAFAPEKGLVKHRVSRPFVVQMQYVQGQG